MVRACSLQGFLVEIRRGFGPRFAQSKIFKMFDFDDDKSLTIAELKRAFRALGLAKRTGGKLQMDEAMFKSFDTNGDGKVRAIRVINHSSPSDCRSRALSLPLVLSPLSSHSGDA